MVDHIYYESFFDEVVSVYNLHRNDGEFQLALLYVLCNIKESIDEVSCHIESLGMHEPIKVEF